MDMEGLPPAPAMATEQPLRASTRNRKRTPVVKSPVKRKRSKAQAQPAPKVVGDSDSVFVGEPFLAGEAHSRWPNRYKCQRGPKTSEGGSVHADHTEGSEDKYGDGGGDEPHRDVNPADLRLINQLQLDLEKAQAELRTQGDTTKKALEDKDKALADAREKNGKLEEENSKLKKEKAEWAKKSVQQVNKIKVRLDQHFIDSTKYLKDTTKEMSDMLDALEDKDKSLADAREKNGKLEEENSKLKKKVAEWAKALEDKDKALADAREKNGKLEEELKKEKAEWAKKLVQQVNKIKVRLNELTEDVEQNLDLSK